MRASWAAVHFTPVLGAPAVNRDRLVEAARRGAEAAGLVVLPELPATGFVVGPEQAQAWAEPLDGPTVRALAGVARGCGAVVVSGHLWRDRAGVLRNAQVVLDARGEVAGVYCKRRLYGADHGWAVAGSAEGGVVEVGGMRVGLLVCHDVVYPETVLGVARGRPDVVAFSTAWIGDASPVPREWVLGWVLVDRVPWVAANRGGVEAGEVFTGASVVMTLRADGLMGGAVGRPGVETQVVKV